LCACWVPKILTDEHRVKRQGSALQFLSRYEEEGDNFLSRIVTGGTRFGFLMSPLNQNNKVWSGDIPHRHQRKRANRH
jgi:hypothetical protein